MCAKFELWKEGEKARRADTPDCFSRDSHFSFAPDLASPGSWVRLICLPRNRHPHTVGSPPVVRCPTFVVRSYTWERCCKVRLLSEAPPASPPLLPGSLLIVSLYCKHSARADEAPYPACQSPATIHYDVFWDQISCTSHSRESSDNLNVIASSGASQPAASSLCNRIFEVPRSPGHGHNLGCSHVGHLWLQTPTYHIRVAPNFRADARTS